MSLPSHAIERIAGRRAAGATSGSAQEVVEEYPSPVRPGRASRLDRQVAAALPELDAHRPDCTRHGGVPQEAQALRGPAVPAAEDARVEREEADDAPARAASARAGWSATRRSRRNQTTMSGRPSMPRTLTAAARAGQG